MNVFLKHDRRVGENRTYRTDKTYKTDFSGLVLAPALWIALFGMVAAR